MHKLGGERRKEVVGRGKGRREEEGKGKRGEGKGKGRGGGKERGLSRQLFA